MLYAWFLSKERSPCNFATLYDIILLQVKLTVTVLINNIYAHTCKCISYHEELTAVKKELRLKVRFDHVAICAIIWTECLSSLSFLRSYNQYF